MDAADPLLADPEILQILQRTHTALGFSDGMTHTELKLTPTGPQPDRRAVEQVDGGQDDHESTNPRRSSRPAAWLFSG